MKRFEAQKLVNSIRCLMNNSDIFVDLHNENPHSLNPALLAEIKRQITALSECCKAADLPMSVLYVNRLLMFFDFKVNEGAIAENILDAIKKSLITVEDELSLRMYFSLEPKEADHYNFPLAGWEKIIDRFKNPEITRNVEEMNKCFALCRYSASMFHAMHVAEWGAIELGDFIGVSDPKKGWGATEKKLAELIKVGHAQLPAHLANKFQFLEQINQAMNTMVLAWRHKIDHAANHLAILPSAEFAPDLAEHIMSAIKVFMTRLMEDI